MKSYPGADDGFTPWEQQGTLQLTPRTYGHSIHGAPLHYFGPESCDLLVIAGIHGEEGETVMLVSRALRLLGTKLSAGVVLCANPDGLAWGTRGNAGGIDLNRNFPTSNWQSQATTCRLILEIPSVTQLSPGGRPASEPETQALLKLISQVQPQRILSIHAPLHCVDAPKSPWSQQLAKLFELPLVEDIGYPTPGSLGTWCQENHIDCVTLELPRLASELLAQRYAAILAKILSET